VDGERVMNGSRSTIGYTDGIRRSEAALFFFFFFY